MPPSTKQPGSEKKNFETVKSGDFRSFYCNHVQGSITAFDISLLFSQASRSQDNADPKVIVENRAQITFSPLEAKILAMITKNIVEQYEHNYGPIPDIPGTLPSLWKPGEPKNNEG